VLYSSEQYRYIEKFKWWTIIAIWGKAIGIYCILYIHDILFLQCSFNDFMAGRFTMILCHIFIYEFLIATQAMVRLFHIIIINTLNIKKASLNMNFSWKNKSEAYRWYQYWKWHCLCWCRFIQEKVSLVIEGLSRQYADCLYKIPKECYGIKHNRFSISHENRN